MLSFSLFPLITRPTRITDTSATLIDHIWASDVQLNCNNYVIQTDITDHYPVISQFKLNHTEHAYSTQMNKRFVTMTALNTFNSELSQVNWDDMLQVSHPNEAFNIFFEKFNNIFQKHFPEKLVRVSRKKIDVHI